MTKCTPTQSVTNIDACPIPVAQVHIALAGRNELGDSNGMTISWSTPNATGAPEALFGLDEKNLSNKVPGDSIQYLTDAWYHHHATLEDLKPDTVYYYKCGDSTAGYSTVRSFRTPKSGGTPAAGGFKVSVFGDWGFSKKGNAIPTYTALHQIEPEVDFVWHLGDVGYADDAFLHDPTSFQYENVYNGYMEWVSNFTSTKPYMVMPGNHETECHSPSCLTHPKRLKSLSNYTAFLSRFKMPFEASNATSNMWYSFNYGMAHFVCIDSETDYPDAPEGKSGETGTIPSGGFGKDGEFVSWLEADLAKANEERAQRPWIFVGGHRPIYADTADDPLRKAVEELLHKYHVDIYFSGHQHSYTRSLPTYNLVPEPNYQSPNNTAYVVVGSAGCDEMDNENPDGYDTSAPWIVTHDHHYGTGVLTVANASAARWQFIHSDDLSVQDEFWLTK